ncbi:MAG: lysine--tRNA ligase [Deltaproteobacteria bacterium]|nr:lysine--tRNA ligase [Deltaproteobacteria bacterium]
MSEKSSERAEELVEVRRQKAEALRELGVHPFGTARPVGHTLADLGAAVAEIEDLPEEAGLAADAPRYELAGRILAIRDFGKGAFVRFRDRSFGEGQAFLKKDLLSADGRSDWDVYKKADLGDTLRISGPQFKTRRGDRAVLAEEFTLLTKALRAPPEKWHGLTDKEQRYRQRYLDLISNAEVREAFRLRSQAVSWIRRFFDERDFLEVETPMMHSLVSGATAKPFKTHHNALDLDLNLRIAPELHLKRLVVGGFERVYEIGRNFRNEGLSPRHNPEFTMLEFYWAHATWEELCQLTEELCCGLVKHLGVGKADAPYVIEYQGQEIDFSPGWPRRTMRELVLEKNEMLTAEDLLDAEKLRERARAVVEDDALHKSLNRLTAGELLAVLFEETVEAGLIAPTFVTGFPVEVSPLARKNDADPALTDRFELIVGGREIANGFNELNDPDDQRERFAAQMAAKAEGADETMDYDEDYITALEHGLPPTAGEGIGIDRLIMFLTDAASIRDVILFPLLRPSEGAGE